MEPMNRKGEPMKRRRVLLGLGSFGFVALAGCTDDPEDEPADGVDDDAADPDDDVDDDVDNGVDDDSDDDDSDGDVDDETDDDGDDGDTDDTDTDDTDDTDTDDTDDADDGEQVRFGDVVQFTDSYAFEMVSGEAGVAAWSGRVHGGNSYMRIEDESEVMEMYTVDEVTYIVQGGECFQLSPEELDEMDEFDDDRAEEPDVDTHEDEIGAHPELEPVGRDEIDGEEVYVFELQAEEVEEYDTAVTYYVSIETGYLRRIRTGEFVLDFHSWGKADPIEPPDMECIDMSDWEDDWGEDDWDD